MTRKITKKSRSVYKDFSSGTVQPAKQQPGMPEIPKNDVRTLPGTTNFSYPNTGAYRETKNPLRAIGGGAPDPNINNADNTGTRSGGYIPKATTSKVPGGPMPGQEAPSPNRPKMAPTGNQGGSVARTAAKITQSGNTQPGLSQKPASRAAAVPDVSGNVPPPPPPAAAAAAGKDGYSAEDRLKYMNTNPKSLTRGSKEATDYWNWFNSSKVNNVQTDQAKQNQYLKWSNQSEQGWWAQGKRREGAALDYKQRSEAGLLPEQQQAADPAYQAWQASMNEDNRKNAWYAAGVDPADAEKLYGKTTDGQSYWPDPNNNYKNFYDVTTTTTTTDGGDTTDYSNYPYDANGNYLFSDRATGNDINALNGQTFKRMNKRQPTMKSIRKEEAPPAWWTQTRNRRYNAQDAQAAAAKEMADAAAKNAWQASMEEDKRKNAWWALGIDPASQAPGAIPGQNPFDSNNNFLFSDRATGNDINANSVPKPRTTKKPASKPASKPKTVNPYKLNSVYTMDDQGMTTTAYRAPKPVIQNGPKGPYIIGYTDSAPQYNESRPIGYKGPAKGYNGMPVATTFRGVPLNQLPDGTMLPRGANLPAYQGQIDTTNTGTLKRMTKRAKKEPICENCGMPVSQCDCAGHSHKSSKKMTKGINLRAIGTSLGRMISDSKPVVRAMRRAESPIGLRRGLKDLATNAVFEIHPTGIRQAINEAKFSGPLAGGMEWKTPADKRRLMASYNRSISPLRHYDPRKVAEFKSAMKTLGKGAIIGNGVKLILDKLVPEQTKQKISSLFGESTTKRIRKSMSPNLGGFIESTEYKMTATPGKKPKISVSHTDTPIISKRATGPTPNKYFQ